MTSDFNEISFIAEHYFFFKTPPLNQIETALVRRNKYEKQARNAMKKFSKFDTDSLTNYQAEQNEIAAWINLAIAECGKIQKHKEGF